MQFIASLGCIFCRLGAFPYDAGDEPLRARCAVAQMLSACGSDRNAPRHSKECSRALCSCHTARATQIQALLGCAAACSQCPPKTFCCLQLASEQALSWLPCEGDEFSSPDTKEMMLSQGYTVQPTLSLPKLPTIPQKSVSLATYTGNKWSRSHWRWTCWGGACEWPRSSGAGKGWCAPWVQTSSPAQQSHWDSQRCTWWWFAPRREWAQSIVFQYGKLWNAKCQKH